jgi:CTP:phosphocholine cytidylyltransferase-like protein
MSGNESERVLKEFHNLDILNEIIIFCFEINKYLYLKSLYNKVTLITNSFGEIVNTLRTKKLAKDDLKMENHIQLTPLISYFDYKKVIFPIHRILAYFFDQKYNSFS